MIVLNPGVSYKLLYFSDKEKSIQIDFVEKIHKKIPLLEESTDKVYIDGIIEFKDGTFNEEIFYMMLDRYKELNERHYSKSNDKIINWLKEIIGETKNRRKTKYENKRKYEEHLKSGE
jgi:hypothetical protein